MEKIEKFNQIIDEAYEDYTNYPLATIQDYRTNILYQNKDKGWCKRNGRSVVSPHPTRHLTKDEFVNKCKTDLDFSQKWGLHIEERELSLEERHQISLSRIGHNGIADRDNITWHETYNKTGIPTKLITLKYKKETIESYE